MKKKRTTKPPKQEMYTGIMPGRKTAILLLCSICLLTFLVYFPALFHSFTNWDDYDYVTGNPGIRSISPSALARIFSQPMVTNYHPLTMLSFAVNWYFTGDKPWSYLLVNILLHLANTILTYSFTRQVLNGNRTMALFVAAVFAVHPMHVESVAWVSGRKDVLYTFFFLSSCVVWFRYISARSWQSYLASLVLGACAMLSKPSAVILPFTLLLIDFIRIRKPVLPLITEKIPYLAVAATVGIATFIIQQPVTVDLTNYTILQRFLFGTYGLTLYLFMFILPAGQSVFHPFPVQDVTSGLPMLYYLAPVGCILLTVGAIYSLRRTRMVLFGLLFFLLNIILTLQFIQVGIALIAERYTYLSYTGLLIGVAWMVVRLLNQRRVSPSIMYSLLIVWTVALTIVTVQRIRNWKDSETLWTEVIRTYPDCYPAYKIRGHFYMTEGRPAEALRDFTQALSINPKDVMVIAWRGNVFADLSQPHRALIELDHARQLNPDLAGTLGNRGIVLYRLGRYPEAIRDLSEEIRINPGKPLLLLYRARAYRLAGMPKEADEDLKAALESGADTTGIKW